MISRLTKEDTIAICFGTRPELIKFAPVIPRAFQQRGVKHIVVNSGQHTDLLQPLLAKFGIVPISISRP